MTELPSSTGGPDDKRQKFEEQAAAVVKALQSAGSGSLSIAEGFSELLTHVGREASRLREQRYIQPFIFEAKDLAAFDVIVRRILASFEVEKGVIFDCQITLENRRTISLQSVSEMDSLTDADKSHPNSICATWTYFFTVEWAQFKVPIPYKIELTYSTNPRHDIVGTMTFIAAPEQVIEVRIHGPHLLIQSANDEIDALVQSTFLPAWWRYPKRTLQLMEPYLGFAIYGASISTVLILFTNYEKWTGRSLTGDKTEAQLRKEILADRQVYFDKLKKTNEQQLRTLNAIVAEKDAGKKLDLYSSYALKPVEPKSFTPIDDLFKGGNFLPMIGYFFLAFCVAGLLHMGLLQVYKRLTPPSVIAIGRLGRRRHRLYRVYDWLAITLIGGAAIPFLSAVAAAIQEFFQP